MQIRTLRHLTITLLLIGAQMSCGGKREEDNAPKFADRTQGQSASDDPASLNPDASRYEEPEMPRISVDPVAEMQDPSPRVRAEAILELKKTPTPEKIKILEEAARDADPSVSAMAGRALGEIYLKGRLPAADVVEMIGDSSLLPKTRVGILLGFSKKISPEATRILLDRLENGTPEERRLAAGMIPHQGFDVAIPALKAALNDPDEWVRFNAREALDNIASGDYRDPKAGARSRSR